MQYTSGFLWLVTLWVYAWVLRDYFNYRGNRLLCKPGFLIKRPVINHADWVYRKYGLKDKLSDDYFYRTEQLLSSAFAGLGISCR